jgi:hypothetical protein
MNQSTDSGKVDGVIVIADPDDISPYIGGNKKTVALFEMTGCPYCRMFQGRFIDFAGSRPGEFAFLRVTLDDPNNPLWSKYEIHAVPTVIAFERSEIIARVDSILAFGLSKKKWAEFCAGI